MKPVLHDKGRKGDWLQTYTGKAFWPFDPHLDEIDIFDIAHSLAHQCRYAGHCIRFYSVAEHCLHVSRLCSQENKLWGLLHDATEAYLVDLPRPIKWHLPDYKVIEAELESVIASKFNLSLPIPLEVKLIDDCILDLEREQNMSEPPYDWQVHNHLGVYVRIQNWDPIKAEDEFLNEFLRLSKGINK